MPVTKTKEADPNLRDQAPSRRLGRRLLGIPLRLVQRVFGLLRRKPRRSINPNIYPLY